MIDDVWNVYVAFDDKTLDRELNRAEAEGYEVKHVLMASQDGSTDYFRILARKKEETKEI